jgi:hypothetical protein
MSPQTVRLLTSSDAVIGYLVGLVGLLVLGIVAMVRPRPVPLGGVAIAAAGIAAFSRIYAAPAELLYGVGLLVVAGLLPVRSLAGTMLLSLPGAAALGYTFVDIDRPELIVFVVSGITLLGALVAFFDETHSDGTGTTLMVLAYGGVMVLVPDTDWVVLAFTAALPMIVAGYPLRWVRLGRPGALGATGLLLWMAASGGAARPETVLVAVGVLGLLVADPIAHLIGGDVRATSTGRGPWMRIGAQVVIGIVLGLVVRGTSQIAVVALALLVALVGATLWASVTG